MAHLPGTAFDFYFDRFTVDSDPTNKVKDYVEAKSVMLESFSVRKIESQIMKEAISLEYDDGDIQAFLTRAHKLYSQAKFKKQSKFGLLRDFPKSDRMSLQFMLVRGAKSYNEIKKACIEYSDNRKIVAGPVTNNGRFTVQS